MAEKKTAHIAFIRENINNRNKKSTCSPDVRHGWNELLTTILMEYDAYHGFGYLTAKDVPQGHKPGIAKDENGEKIFPDESRVFFY